MLVGLISGLIIGLCNSVPSLGIYVLNLFCYLLGLLARLRWIRDWNKVQWTPWIALIHHLKGRKACALARCSVEYKFGVVTQLIPPLDALFGCNPKYGTQSAVGYFGLAVH